VAKPYPDGPDANEAHVAQIEAKAARLRAKADELDAEADRIRAEHPSDDGEHCASGNTYDRPGEWGQCRFCDHYEPF
jgi:hypothetical protein